MVIVSPSFEFLRVHLPIAMTTAKHAAANKQNSAKSSGPKTSAGKATSSENSIKHGSITTKDAKSPPAPPDATERCGTSETDSALLIAGRLPILTPHPAAVPIQLFSPTRG